MRIAIFFERFLAQYGADRVHIEQARAFRKAGHQVFLFGKFFSEDVRREFDGYCVIGPKGHGIEDDCEASKHVEAFLQGFKNRRVEFDIAIHGGWPYLSSIEVTKQFCKSVIFVDFGVVPNRGYAVEQRAYLARVHSLRRRYLPVCDKVVSISNFIKNTQALADVPDASKHAVIYLGGDHVDRSAAVPLVPNESPSLRLFEHISHRFRSVIFQVGRYEPHTYKNSEQLFSFAEFLQTFSPETAFCYLGDIDNVHTPRELRGSVFAIGTPPDEVMFQILRRCSFAICPSSWEGFDLPLLEAQWLGKPCLIFDVGAHQEVAWSKDSICTDPFDMKMKIIHRLNANVFELDLPADEVAENKARFTWQRMAEGYLGLFERL
jgi:glycosyltransferase involved in cell wall biosynthesis